MPEPPATRFPLIERYLAIRLDVDLPALRAGHTAIVGTPRRLAREYGCGYHRVLWWLALPEGRSAVSVPPGTEGAVAAVLGDNPPPEAMDDPALVERLCQAVAPAVTAAGLPRPDRVLRDLQFACNAARLRRPPGPVVRLTDTRTPPAAGLALPVHCLPDGIAYGVVVGGRVVSVAYAHRTGVMEDRVADIGVVTAPDWRGRGFARRAVAAVVAHVTAAGGEARYACRPDNFASRAVAQAVGFVPRGRSLAVTAPWHLAGG